MVADDSTTTTAKHLKIIVCQQTSHTYITYYEEAATIFSATWATWTDSLHSSIQQKMHIWIKDSTCALCKPSRSLTFILRIFWWYYTETYTHTNIEESLRWETYTITTPYLHKITNIHYSQKTLSSNYVYLYTNSNNSRRQFESRISLLCTCWSLDIVGIENIY